MRSREEDTRVFRTISAVVNADGSTSSPDVIVVHNAAGNYTLRIPALRMIKAVLATSSNNAGAIMATIVQPNNILPLYTWNSAWALTDTQFHVRIEGLSRL